MSTSRLQAVPQDSSIVAPNERESSLLVSKAFQIARSLSINTILVHADGLKSFEAIAAVRHTERVIWVTMKESEIEHLCASQDLVLRVPVKKLTRMSQIKISLFVALMNRNIGFSEKVICLTGISGLSGLDTMVITDPQRDFAWVRGQRMEILDSFKNSRVFERAIDIALHLSSEGREGKPIGTIFVIGETEQLLPYCRQFILNPLEGHAQNDRSIHNPPFLDTLRELSALDGAFIINPEGIVESAGTYLNPPAKRIPLRLGLGARHNAAAALSAHTEAIAIVISESNGAITVYFHGKPVLELEKPMPPLSRPKRK